MNTINYPLLFQAAYCETLALEPSVFSGIHSYLWPRITGQVIDHAQSMDTQSMARGKPIQQAGGFRRASLAMPSAEDGRYYFTVEGRDDTAVIPISGVLVKGAGLLQEWCMGMTNIDRIGYALGQAMGEKSIKNIVLDVNSPGGKTTGIYELGNTIRAAAQTRGKTLYAFSDDTTASAAYWLASQANEMYVTPTSRTGSIGTILGLLDESVRMQMTGVKMEVFSAGKHKAMGTPGRTLTQEDRAYLQEMVDKANASFLGAVTTARPKIASEAVTDAKVYDGPDAARLRMVDGLVNSWDEFVGLL